MQKQPSPPAKDVLYKTSFTRPEISLKPGAANSEYSPPMRSWISTSMKKLHLSSSLADASPLITADPAEVAGSPRTVVPIPGRGHCGFMSLSYLLTGSVKYHLNIRKAVVDNIINIGNRGFTKSSLERANRQKKALPTMGDEVAVEFWMNEDDMLSFCDLMQCIVLSYQAHQKLYFINRPVLTSKSSRISDDLLPRLIIEFVNENHYNAVIDVYERKSI